MPEIFWGYIFIYPIDIARFYGKDIHAGNGVARKTVRHSDEYSATHCHCDDGKGHLILSERAPREVRKPLDISVIAFLNLFPLNFCLFKVSLPTGVARRLFAADLTWEAFTVHNWWTHKESIHQDARAACILGRGWYQSDSLRLAGEG